MGSHLVGWEDLLIPVMVTATDASGLDVSESRRWGCGRD